MSEPGPTPRADLFWALAWIAVGAAMFAGGFTMDRLERQHINPYTAPGLVPALLGIGIAVLGAILLVRSVRRGALAAADGGRAAADGGRLALALGLCLAYAGGLVGRTLFGWHVPFWLATALFVFASIVAFEWRDRRARGELGRGIAVAAACALGTAAGVTLVFQEVFLVRLP
ncbi:MAG: tripartite tricarboxylate transporter TctB family protein [Burkholderiales bacterium]